MIQEHQLKNYTWLEVVKPNPEEAQQLVNDHQLPPKFKNYMLDRHEQPHATFDLVGRFDVLVVRAMAFSKHQVSNTTPIFIGFSPHLLITVTHTSGAMHLFSRMPLDPNDYLYHQIFRVLQRVLQPYFQEVDNITEIAEEMTNNSKIDQARLNKISTLKAKMVYLRSATAGNLIALQELRDILRQRLGKDFPSRRQILSELNDLIVEFRQCQTTFDVASDEVSETETSYGDILNYRLNETMMFLTIWSLILAVPPIISGFYGMNTYLPLANKHLAWVYSLIMTLALIVVVVVLFKIHQRRQH